MKKQAPRRTLVRANRHYAMFRLEEEQPRANEQELVAIEDEPSDEAIWAVLEHIPLRGRQLEMVLDMLSRAPAARY